MQAGERYAIGIDYGSNSVRCLIVDCFDGHEAGVSVWNYRGGEAGVYLSQARRASICRRTIRTSRANARSISPTDWRRLFQPP